MAAPIGFGLDAVPIWFVEIALSGNTFKYQRIATNSQATGFAKNTTTTYIAVCRSGLIYRTTNIASGLWSLVYTQPANVDFLDIAFGNGVFVAIGRAGIIYTSTDDGFTWVARSSGTTNDLQRVIFGNSMFLTAGDNNTLRYSNSAATAWNASTITNLSTNSYNIVDFVWTGLRWIAVGNNRPSTALTYMSSLGGGFILTSPDGITFTAVAVINGAVNINSIAYNGANQAVAVGDYGFYYSSDATGSAWATFSFRYFGRLSLIRFINNQYILINQNGVVYSGNNALTFTEISRNVTFVYDIYYDTGNYYFLNNTQIAISPLVGLSYLRITTSPIDLNFRGFAFKSDQRLVGIGRVTQSLKNDGSQFSLQFAGQDYTLRDEFFSYNLQDKLLTVWVAVGNANWESGPLAVWFSGYINSTGWDINVTSSLTGSTDSIFTIGCKDLVARLKGSLAGRPANPSGMKRFFPNDTSHDQLAAERDRVTLLGKGVAQ